VWKVRRDGSRLDDGKITYGQSFAIYALAEYYLATSDRRALDYASQTFDLLQSMPLTPNGEGITKTSRKIGPSPSLVSKAVIAKALTPICI
jgi:mannose/cellobiose epimerase-like protein (N-acyl-D-glucosamine 2-epimerase family)